MTNQRIAKRLAEALVSGPWDADSLLATAGRVLIRRPKSFLKLMPRLIAHCGANSRPRVARIVRFLGEDRAFRRACGRKSIVFAVGEKAFATPVMWPAVGGPSTWAVPSILTPEALADFLGVSGDELEWLADRQARERHQGFQASRRYTYRWVPKRSGSTRLIEMPCSRLRFVQTRLLREVIDRIPPHESAHGFRRGRSIRTYVEPHIGQRVVLKLDLQHFFPTITAGRVLAIFLAAGYPEPVARLMAGLSTNTLPSSEWTRSDEFLRIDRDWQARKFYRQPHLPQGAPTSPALANLSAHRLDARLAGLARSIGASYTRYADDLAFSGNEEFERSVARLPVPIMAIAIEEGFAINPRKTRIMRQGVRQLVAGVVINERTNLPRKDYDLLKATLHNCLKHGPKEQNRSNRNDFRAHLLGRIAHVKMLNPERAKKLRDVFDQIKWDG